MARGRSQETGHKARRRGRRSSGFRRMLSLLAFMPLASRAPMYARLVWSLVADERTPTARKALLGGALGYVFLGRDLVPDYVPLIGGIDDIIVVVLAVDLFLDGVPEDLLQEKLDAIGIERAAFDQDVARIRRLVPGPVRRSIHRLSDFVGYGGRAWADAGIGPMVRTWITKEDRKA